MCMPKNVEHSGTAFQIKIPYLFINLLSVYQERKEQCKRQTCTRRMQKQILKHNINTSNTIITQYKTTHENAHQTQKQYKIYLEGTTETFVGHMRITIFNLFIYLWLLSSQHSWCVQFPRCQWEPGSRS